MLPVRFLARGESRIIKEQPGQPRLVARPRCCDQAQRTTTTLIVPRSSRRRQKSSPVPRTVNCESLGSTRQVGSSLSLVRGYSSSDEHRKETRAVTLLLQYPEPHQ